MNDNLYDLKIIHVEFPQLHIIKIQLSDGSYYTADLSKDFILVPVFPKNIHEWSKGRIGNGEFSIEWPSGFDIHFDHIVESCHQTCGSKGA